MDSIQEENNSHKDFQYKAKEIKVNEALSVKK